MLPGLRAAPGAPGDAPVHPHPAPRSGGDAGRKPGAPRTAALPGLDRSGATPRRPGLWLRLCPGAPSAAAAARVARAGPVLTCAPSAEQRAESGGAGARHPRGGPCSGGGRLHSLRCEGEGASLCCLFIRQRLRLGIGRQEDVPAPAPLALTPDAAPPLPPRPSAPTSPPLLQRWGRSSEGGFCSAPSLRLPKTPCPAALLRSLGFCDGSPSAPTESYQAAF